MNRPDLSVIIPFYNRASTIHHTLRSIDVARRGLDVEIILVDDGSEPPAEQQLQPTLNSVNKLVRQENRGLLFARLTGLAAAAGEFVVFLDSDDLVGPGKFREQLAAMRATSADVSYTDVAHIDIGADGSVSPVRDASVIEETNDPGILFIRIQPAPHSPVFRTDYIRALTERPLFLPHRRYNPVAEIWFYHIAALAPARIIKVPGPHTLVGNHGGARITNHWEKMGHAACTVVEDFLKACPRTENTRPVRQLVAERAFHSWRALPHGYLASYNRRLLANWRQAPDPRTAARTLSGRGFRALSAMVGAVAAGRLLRRFQRPSYTSCRTLDETELAKVAVEQ
jgi:glycosyltransferase involved in cell wall biosynthesis